MRYPKYLAGRSGWRHSQPTIRDLVEQGRQDFICGEKRSQTSTERARGYDEAKADGELKRRLADRIFGELGRVIGSPVEPDLYAAHFRVTTEEVSEAINMLLVEGRAVVRNNDRLYRRD